MKKSLITFGLGGVLLAVPALAIERPDKPAPKQDPVPEQPEAAPAPAEDRQAPEAPEAPKDRMARPAPAREEAYIGIGGCTVPEVLSVHLGLAEGSGLLVRSLDPNGAAAQAGITEHDIILKLDDQPVKCQETLRDVIVAHKPGDKVKLDLIHAGKNEQREVTLGKREVRAPQVARGVLGANEDLENMLDMMPADQAKRLRDVIEGNLREMEGAGVARDVPEALRHARELMEQGIRDGGRNGFKFQAMAKSSVRMLDDKGSVELTTEQGAKEAKVYDKDGKLLWQGPYDTPQDKAAAPEDIRERIDKLGVSVRGNQMRLQIGPNGLNAAPVDPEEFEEAPKDK